MPCGWRAKSTHYCHSLRCCTTLAYKSIVVYVTVTIFLGGDVCGRRYVAKRPLLSSHSVSLPLSTPLLPPSPPPCTTRRLWHQLTVALLEFVSDPANAEAGGGLVRLCTEFIAKFEAKMNQLRFVQILCAVGKTCSGGWVGVLRMM